MTEPSGDPSQRRARRVGRRVGQVVYYAVVGAFVVAATWQVTEQVFFPTPPTLTHAIRSCEEGLETLLSGIEAAKRAAATEDGHQHEEAALERFRDVISPIWAQRDAIGEQCRAPEHKRLLDALDRLRYSEEHGVRKQAAELTALRRRVEGMAAEVLGRPPAQ